MTDLEYSDGFNIYRRAYHDQRTTTHDAIDLLEYLTPLVKRGVVTNGLIEVQREKLEYPGLSQFTNCLLTSEEAGVKSLIQTSS